ncbi:hypothetical protein MLD38_029047 [Melastoma candidum]|uniref:Uncharacterized protein n=1 Tax=Melastoma candidum TaxID=119954 RepID=A0ACB9N494_9MYRT|nr:hypothetical protein MLD38_029047 [Melastoma candidum]
MASNLRLLRQHVSRFCKPSPPPTYGGFSSRCLVSVSSHPPEKISDFSPHTAKWMQDSSNKSPMELINEIPPIKVEGRIVACEGDSNPALGHPIEFICLDKAEPAVCKYCGLRYVQDHHH